MACSSTNEWCRRNHACVNFERRGDFGYCLERQRGGVRAYETKPRISQCFVSGSNAAFPTYPTTVTQTGVTHLLEWALYKKRHQRGAQVGSHPRPKLSVSNTVFTSSANAYANISAT